MSIMLKENFYFQSKIPQNTPKKIKKKNNFGIIFGNFGLKEKIRGYEKLFFRFLSKNQQRGKLNNKQVLPLNGKSNWRFIAFLLCIALALCTPPKNSASAQTHKTPNIQHNPARRASFRGSPVKVALLEVK